MIGFTELGGPLQDICLVKTMFYRTNKVFAQWPVQFSIVEGELSGEGGGEAGDEGGMSSSITFCTFCSVPFALNS